MHPVTRQRWARFRGLRRGWWGFWGLVAAYAASLFCEWIANEKPLRIRMGGKTYWPVVKFYSEDAFTGNGRKTRADYKALERAGVFEGAKVTWAPLRYGPLESVDPAELAAAGTREVTMRPAERVAVAWVDAEGRITETGGDAAAFGLEVGASPAWPEAVAEGMAGRLEGRSCGAAEAAWAGGEGGTAELSPIAAHAGGMRRVRVLFRKAAVEGKELHARLKEGDPWPEGWPERNDPRWEVRERKERVGFPFRPTKAHPLGLDASGRDVAARMLYALRTSLSFGLLLTAVTMALGTLAGAVQGYCAGRVDLWGQRAVEIWESLPFLYVLILLGSVYGQSFGLLLGVYAVFNWVGISYYMRAEFLRLRKAPFTEAARVMGIPARKIIFRHILPNALVPLVTFFPFQLVGAIGAMAALDYLGFGLPPPEPSWGELLSQAQEFPSAWWLALYPSLALFAVMLAGVFTGEGLRAAFDPRGHGRME